MRLSIEELTQTYADLFVRLGLPEDSALRFCRRQIEVHAFGVTTHGLTVLNAMLNGLEKAESLPKIKAVPVQDHGAITVLEGAGALQLPCLLQTVDLAQERAAQHGLALVSLRNVGWLGALGYHLTYPAREGFFGMAWGHFGGGSTVVPYGGREPRLSTNPVAYCMPADPDPVVADFSTSAISNGKLHRWTTEEKKCPEPMLVDEQTGELTDDPSRFRNGASILPFGGMTGGYRGTAMSLWAELLTAAAGGTTANKKGKGPQNLHILLLDQQKMGDSDIYQTKAAELIEHVKSSAPWDGSTGPRMPGEAGWKKLRQAEAEGIELDDYFANEIQKHCEKRR